MSELLDKLQQELKDDLAALESLEKQLEKCNQVLEIVRHMPDNEAFAILGVGVGETTTAEVNLRGLDTSLVGALVAILERTQQTLTQKIHTIQAKYPEGFDGVALPGQRPIEQHIHYHYHNDCPPPPDMPWCPSGAPRPPKPYDDEQLGGGVCPCPPPPIPPECDCGCKPTEPDIDLEEGEPVPPEELPPGCDCGCGTTPDTTPGDEETTPPTTGGETTDPATPTP